MALNEVLQILLGGVAGGANAFSGMKQDELKRQRDLEGQKALLSHRASLAGASDPDKAFRQKALLNTLSSVARGRAEFGDLPDFGSSLTDINEVISNPQAFDAFIQRALSNKKRAPKLTLTPQQAPNPAGNILDF